MLSIREACTCSARKIPPAYLVENENIPYSHKWAWWDGLCTAVLSNNWELARRIRQPLTHLSVSVRRECRPGSFPQGQYEILTGAHCLMGVTLGRKHLRSFKNTQVSGYWQMFHCISWPHGAGSCRFHSAQLLCTFCFVFFFLLWSRDMWGPKNHTNSSSQWMHKSIFWLKEKWFSISLSLATIKGAGALFI